MKNERMSWSSMLVAIALTSGLAYAGEVERASAGAELPSMASGFAGLKMNVGTLWDRFRGCDPSCRQSKAVRFGKGSTIELKDERQIANLAGDGRFEPYIVETLKARFNFKPEKFIEDIRDPRLAELIRDSAKVLGLFEGPKSQRVDTPWGNQLTVTKNECAEHVDGSAMMDVGSRAYNEIIIQDRFHAGLWAPYQSVFLFRPGQYEVVHFKKEKVISGNGKKAKMIRSALKGEKLFVKLSVLEAKHVQRVSAWFDTATGEVIERSISEVVEYWPNGRRN